VPLRIRLVLILVLFVAVALAAIESITYSTIQSSLISTVDSQMQSSVNNYWRSNRFSRIPTERSINRTALSRRLHRDRKARTRTRMNAAPPAAIRCSRSLSCLPTSSSTSWRRRRRTRGGQRAGRSECTAIAYLPPCSTRGLATSRWCCSWHSRLRASTRR
jgi:hypothetical protein